MTQILVTIDGNELVQNIRKAIKMLRGVVSASILNPTAKTGSQQKYVKDSLKRAFSEIEEAERDGRKLQSADDFIKEISAEMN